MGRNPVAVVNLHITYARSIKVDYSRFSWGGLHGKHVVENGKGKTGTIPAFALGPRKTKKNLDFKLTPCSVLTFWHRNLAFKF
jgi:hypothetical protein